MDYGELGAVLFFIAFFSFLTLKQIEEAETHQTILWIIALTLVAAVILLTIGIIS